VFPESQYSGLLYFNLAQRETHGIVPLQERDALASEVSEKLARLVDPDTGEALFSGIYGPEDVYVGPEAKHAPDLILDGFASSWGTLSTYRELVGGRVRHRFFLERSGDLGQHSRDGVFLFSGQDFAEGPAFLEAHLMDVPATLLYLYGVPIPDDYDGRVMAQAIDPERLARRPVAYQAGDSEGPDPHGVSYSADEAAEVLDHLRALGYVE
jgi:predicted AlkP superfamily phosphohydrolase/phosphomutase